MSSQIAIKLLSDNFHADPRVRDFHAGAIFANSPNEIPRLSSDFERLIGFRARAERIFDLPVSQSSLKKKKKYSRGALLFLFSMLICAPDRIISEARSRVSSKSNLNSPRGARAVPLFWKLV